jgi:2-(1,2-epoxy-1,2-dihydrophenyl)acetyl-CoA isomerase
MDVDGKPDVGAALESTYNPLVGLLRDFPLPIVTAINGAAAGIGCSLALLGDIVVAAESAYFLQAFRRIGLVPDGGSTWMLPRMIGKARAMELMLLGDKVPAATALSWGLINRCVPDAELMATASAIARDLADGPAALSIIRRLVWDSLDAEWGTQLHAERHGQKAAGKTDDFIEGVSAFLQKRPAAFRGR